MATKSFNKYFLTTNAGSQSSYRAIIWLHDGNQTAGRIHFMREDLEPGNGHESTGGLIELYYPASMLTPTLDVLRNESPLHVNLLPNGSGNISMMPGLGEPVGEGE